MCRHRWAAWGFLAASGQTWLISESKDKDLIQKTNVFWAAAEAAAFALLTIQNQPLAMGAHAATLVLGIMNSLAALGM